MLGRTLRYGLRRNWGRWIARQALSALCGRLWRPVYWPGARLAAVAALRTESRYGGLLGIEPIGWELGSTPGNPESWARQWQGCGWV